MRIKNPKKKDNSYDKEINLQNTEFQTFKELLLKRKILERYKETYTYLKKHPHARIENPKILNLFKFILKTLRKENMRWTMISKLYSNNLSDKTIKRYMDENVKFKAHFIKFTKNISDEILNYTIDDILDIALTIKKDTKQRAKK